MKWSKEQEQKLRDLCFQEKSNKEIAAIMNIDLADVHNGRSRFGITVAKVAAVKSKEVKEIISQQAAAQRVKRPKNEIQIEIDKVQKARAEAFKKVERCNERIDQLYKELSEAADADNNN